MENRQKRKLWVISELYYPEMTSTGYYLTKIAEGLADRFDVNVICGQPNYSARGVEAPSREKLNGVKVRRVFGTRLDKNVIPFRVINMLTFGVSVFLAGLFKFGRGDRVLVVTNPPLMPFLTAVVCYLRGSEHFLLIHDSYPEILYAAGKLAPNSFSGRILERFRKKLIRSAARVIVVGRDMQKMIAQKTGVTSNCFVIPNWAELETVSPAPRSDNKLLCELGLENKFVFLYAGNMGYPNDLESLIAAAEKLKTSDEKVHFIFLGAGVKKALLEKSIKTKNLKNITLLASRPRSEQQVFLNGCDVGIVSLVDQMCGVSMPSRTYNILAVGKPILALCDPHSEVAKVVTEEDAGWVVRPGDTDALLRTILEISESGDKLRRKGENARRAAVEKYSLGSAIENYAKVVSD